ncbi:hypothetical protein GUJ93_ZPchr0004g39696 [Zizania palustris]|uniref:Uncharacterized protein n=1 Tax=Zizania palustris TaxID=103762 RepID=A0A8J5VFM1_ZIZPA|nr:hypothetical protein GUJ93_ZPchr0004g39696 [Zizania palustris]
MGKAEAFIPNSGGVTVSDFGDDEGLPETNNSKKRGRVSNKKKTKMPLGGTKRVRATPRSETAPGVSTSVDTVVVQGKEEHDPQPVLDWSIFDDPSNTHEDEVPEQLEVAPEGKSTTCSKKPRPPTKGTLLDNMTKALGRRLPIQVAAENKRPKKHVNNMLQEAKTTNKGYIAGQYDKSFGKKEVSEKNKRNRGKSMMENMLVQPAEGLDTAISSTEIVSRVLSQTSVASIFLKNAGLETPGTKSAASSTREAQLREQLQAEKQRANLLQQELDTLKKKAE